MLESYFVYIGLGLLFVTVSALMVIFVSPVARGSGIDRIKCYLNGVDQKDVFTLGTFFTKSVGICFAIGGGMPCGVEGPMVHIGSIIGANINKFKCAVNQIIYEVTTIRFERDFITAGTACGITAAFGSPIGGVMFCFEEASSFWTVNVMLKVLLATSFSDFTVNYLNEIFSQEL